MHEIASPITLRRSRLVRNAPPAVTPDTEYDDIGSTGSMLVDQAMLFAMGEFRFSIGTDRPLCDKRGRHRQVSF